MAQRFERGVSVFATSRKHQQQHAANDQRLKSKPSVPTHFAMDVDEKKDFCPKMTSEFFFFITSAKNDPLIATRP